jgi:signal transduction histidine kinase/CheY-like chemotaxis protein
MTLDEQSRKLIEQQADEDFARKSLQTGVALLPVALLFIITTEVAGRFPVLAGIHLAVAIATVAFRFWWVKQMPEVYPANPVRWLRIQMLMVVLSSLSWAAFCTVGIWSFPSTSSTGLMLLLFQIGVAATAMVGYITHWRYYVVTIASISLAPMSTVALTWEHGWAILLSYLIYVGYLSLQAYALHQRHRRELVNRRLLELRADELDIARRRANLANEAKGRFLANMSHEIRTPMSGILGMTRLALETELTGEQREYLFTTHQTADSLLRLLDELLDFSRIEADRMELRVETFDVREMLLSIEKLFAHQARAKGLHFRVIGLLPGLPLFRGDSLRIRQVLLNLVSNAIKFTAAGSVWIEVRVEDPQAPRTAVEFTVGDTGIGIPADQKSKIFEPFSQVDHSLTRSIGGSGLGLSISQGLVRMMKGAMELESSPGRGSQFRFSLTLDTGMPADDGLPPDTGFVVDLNRMRILVAEDNAVNQKIISRLLEKAGCNVALAVNGQEAVDLALGAAEPFDAILMDVQMPVLDGLAATRRIRERESQSRNTAIIALTANALEGDQRLCLEAGMDGFLAKPVKAEQLFQALMAQRMKSRETAGLLMASSPSESAYPS